MTFLSIVPTDKAEGDVKKQYDFFLERAGVVPKPFQMLSVSPELMGIQAQAVAYFMGHPTLSFGLLSCIRYLVAKKHDFEFCTDFNKKMLQMQGVTEDDLAVVEKDPASMPLEDNERALLAFVIKAIDDPNSTTAAEMESLHQHGWTDRDIFDAVSHGANMVATSIMMKAFGMDSCDV